METAALTVKSAGLDNDRLIRFESGHSMEEIARDDHVSLAEVQSSIEIAARHEQIRKNHQLMNLRQDAQIENEKIRAHYRKKFHADAETALGKLLKGEKTVVQKNALTGELSEFTYTDVDTIALGLDHYRKSITLEEKPAPAPGTVVNVQSNTNTTIVSSNGNGHSMTFEERIAAIRRDQKHAHEQRSIEPEPEILDGQVESEIIPSPPENAGDDPWAI